DKAEVLVSNYCQCCGNDLHDMTEKFVLRLQVADLPVIKLIYTEYLYYSRKCSCGHEQVSDYPSHVTNHIKYGPVVEATVGYYPVYQHLPYK
ncbi:MAG: IS66 family transposase, partial [bacterium]|nr:IS66 family transposase [bacterium]